MVKKMESQHDPGIFLGLIWSRISAFSKLKNRQKLPKMVYIILNFLVLHFGENFIEIGTKIAKLQMHENFHKNVNENMFHSHFCGNFHKFEGHMLQLYTANFVYGF